LPEQGVDVGFDDLARVGGELDVGGEELGLLERFPAFAADEEVEPPLQPLGAGAFRVGHRREGAEMLASQRSVTASCGAALLGKWR
jgi:hypothetical protein